MKQSTINEVTRGADGSMHIRFALTDGNVTKWHRTVVMPGVAVDDQMSEVNRHLDEMGWPAVDYSGLK